MDELERKCAVLEQKVAKLEADLRKKQTTDSKLLAFAADATKFIEVIQAQEKRAEILSNRLQSYINRECVLTEVSRYVRRLGSVDLLAQFHLQLMKAYNWDNEFWEQRGSGTLTIQEWLDKIMALDDVATVKETKTTEEV
jgi:Tfp pilus assembly protein PilN